MNEETKMPSPKEALEQWLDSSPLHTLLRNNPAGLATIPDDPKLSYRNMFSTQGELVDSAARLAFMEGYAVATRNVLDFAKAEMVKSGKTPIDESQAPTTPQ